MMLILIIVAYIESVYKVHIFVIPASEACLPAGRQAGMTENGN